MKQIFLTAVVALLLTGCLPQKAEIMADTMIAYETAASQKNGAAFGMLKNTTDSEIKIISASSEVADRVELHTHAMDENGMMSMYEVENYTIPANDSLTLHPAGHHIMLMGLKAPLVLGETFNLDLMRENGEAVPVSISIVKAGSAQ